MKCQLCFYLQYRLGIPPPSCPPFTLNLAVDELLKREFDICREKGEPHPLMEDYGIDAVPWPDLIEHPDWRNNFKGIRHLHASTNLDVFGSVDDIWVNEQGELIVVDYKATSRAGEIESFEDERILGVEDEGEDLLVRSYSTDEVKTMLNEGKFINGVALISLQWFYLNYITS